MIFTSDTVEDGYVIYHRNRKLEHYEVVKLLNDYYDRLALSILEKDVKIDEYIRILGGSKK